MSELTDVLIQRDGISRDEADALVATAKQRVDRGDDPAEVLQEEFGLEPDYFLDLYP